MINILFAIDKFVDKNNRHLQNDLTPKFSTCEETNLFKAHFFYTDESNVNEYLITYLNQNKIDVIVFSYFAGHPSYNPTQKTLDEIKAHFPNIKFVFVWWDVLFHPYIRQCIQEVDDVADMHITFDGSSLSELKLSNKGHTFPCPQVSKWYHPDEQIIDVSFMGRINEYADRVMFLKYLACNNCNVNIGGGRIEENLSNEEYARNIRQSKINLNFTLSANGSVYQYKERAYETLMCKSLLLEMNNPFTPLYLTPGKDYIPFSTPFELLDLITYYLQHSEERKAIAQHGYDTYMEKYHCNKLWNKIYTCLNFSL